jgi:predicted CXXCH cytochrome family protein
MVRVSTHIVVILFLTAFLTGCEPQARHQVLTFFFTGVPPLDESGAIVDVKEQPPSAKIIEKPAPEALKALFSHPVWAAGTCNPCHESTGTFSTPGVMRTPATVFKTGGGMPGKLTLPKNELCTQCHKDKTPKRALTDNLWLHNTTAKGDCLACHDPHQSNNEKTLRQAPSILCLPCHKEGRFLATPAHQKGAECLSCHNPHMGLDKNLLTKEYKEIKKPVVLVPGYQDPGR